MWEKDIDINQVVEIRTRTSVFFGVGAIQKIDEILFVEVKTGKSLLSEREKEVKKAIEKGNVRYVEYRIN